MDTADHKATAVVHPVAVIFFSHPHHYFFHFFFHGFNNYQIVPG